MSATFAYMVEETLGMLRGFARAAEQTTHLTSALDATSLSFTVNDVSQVSRGIAEIGDELVWIDTVNTTTSTVVLAPYGRGFNGSLAAAHAINDRVTFSPLFPRIRIKRGLNDTLLSLRGILNGNATTTFNYVAARAGYDMPAAAYDVFRVQWYPPGPTKGAVPVRHWRFDKDADPATFTTGKAIELLDGLTPGRTVQVWYATQPQELVNDADDFVTVSGLDDSARDVVVLGAAYRMVQAVDPSRLNTFSVSADALDTKVNVGSGNAVAKYLFQMFMQRRSEEQKRLLDARPFSIHYVR